MRPETPASSPRPARGFVLFVWVLLAALAVFGHQLAPVDRGDIVPLVALLLLGALSRVLPDSLVMLSGDGVRFSFFGIVILAGAVLVGPLGGAIIGVLVTLLRAGNVWSLRRVFNAGMFGVTGLVGGLVYTLMGGADPMGVHGTTDVLLLVGVPLIAADLAQAATNALLLSGIIWVTAGVPFWVQVRNLLSTTGVAYVAYGVIAFLFVVLWGPAGLSWFSAVLTVVPLLVAWWAFGQYGAELEAHERTTDTLVAALDMRHAGAAAHAQRVAMLCGWIGESLRISPRGLGELRTAGLLHDIGLLASRDGDESVLDHPVTGVRMLADISFAAPVLPVIAAHHERLDGSGYPHGMLGPEIPLGSRIVAVADTFDALTLGTTELGALSPQDALDRIEQDPGLDQDVVAALRQAAERHGFLEAPAGGWLGHAKFAERTPTESVEGIRVSIARIAAELAQEPMTPSWITRHDHPDLKVHR